MPASRRIPARRTEAEARINLIRNLGGEEYYSDRAVTACARNTGTNNRVQYACMSEMDFIRPLAPIGVIVAVLVIPGGKRKSVGG